MTYRKNFNLVRIKGPVAEARAAALSQIQHRRAGIGAHQSAGELISSQHAVRHHDANLRLHQKLGSLLRACKVKQPISNIALITMLSLEFRYDTLVWPIRARGWYEGRARSTRQRSIYGR